LRPPTSTSLPPLYYGYGAIVKPNVVNALFDNELYCYVYHFVIVYNGLIIAQWPQCTYQARQRGSGLQNSDCFAICGELSATVKKWCSAGCGTSLFCGCAGVSKGGGKLPLAHDLACKV